MDVTQGQQDADAPLDEIDAQLLQLLVSDGRASLRSLAERIGMSSPSVADRIARLTERGIITGFTVSIDWARLGLPTLTHIALLTDKTSDIENIVRELHRIDRVEEISIVTGSTDLLVRARIRDVQDLRRLLVERIWPIEGIQRVETTLAVETLVSEDHTAAMIQAHTASTQARDADAAEDASPPRRRAPRTKGA